MFILFAFIFVVEWNNAQGRQLTDTIVNENPFGRSQAKMFDLVDNAALEVSLVDVENENGTRDPSLEGYAASTKYSGERLQHAIGSYKTRSILCPQKCL